MHTQHHLPQHHMRGMGRIGICIAIAALAFIAWSIISAHRAAAALRQSTEEQAVDTVSVIRPAPQNGGGEAVLPGTLQATTDAPIYARTSGYLKRWLTDIGAHVKAGQLLAEIETPEVDQQLQQAQADLATAQANAQIAQLTAERWRDLRRTDSVSQQDADEKLSLAAASKAQLRSAQANVQRLKELVSFARIVAPFDGVITARQTDVGQLITAGGGAGPELFRISDGHELRLYVRVPQSYAAAMTPKIQADVAVPDRPGERFPARLVSTARAIDTATNSLLVQLAVDNTKGELLPGSYGEVHFRLPAATSSFRVPANTVLFRGEGTLVATVDGSSHVVLKPVILGRDYGQTVEIVSGLAATDNIVLSPPDSLIDHALVRVAAPTGARVAQAGS